MNKQDIQILFDYNYWANARVLAAAARVSREQFTAPAGLSHDSLRGILVHTLGAEVIWRIRCQEGGSPTTLLSADQFPTLAALQAYWQKEEQAMRGYLASLDDEALNRTIHYRSTKGAPLENVLWHILAHVVNHGTQSRAEAGLALAAYGQSPGDIDLILFFRERKAG